MTTKLPSLPDSAILDLIRSGELVVDHVLATCSRNRKHKVATIVGRDDRNGTRYRYELRVCGYNKRTISRARLVYMAATDALIPEGFEVHHLDGDRYNDAFSNLICVSKVDHLKLHNAYKPPTNDAPL